MMTAREEYEACAASVRSTAITNREKEINFILARADAALAEADEQAQHWADSSKRFHDMWKQAEQRVRELEEFVTFVRRTAGDQWTDNVLAITASRLTTPESKE